MRTCFSRLCLYLGIHIAKRPPGRESLRTGSSNLVLMVIARVQDARTLSRWAHVNSKPPAIRLPSQLRCRLTWWAGGVPSYICTCLSRSLPDCQASRACCRFDGAGSQSQRSRVVPTAMARNTTYVTLEAIPAVQDPRQYNTGGSTTSTYLKRPT